MKIATAVIVFALGWTGAQSLGAAQPTAAEVRDLAKQVLGVIPDKMPGSEHDTPARIELGRKLYFERGLSINNSQSCNSCHMVDKQRGGVDNEPTSPGAFGKRGGRNSPTTLNAGFQIAQFWDGRAANLKEQAKGPVLNPIEMAMPSEPEVLARLRQHREYPALFKKAFPNDADPITYDNFAEAVAAFERTLITRDRFDDFQKGSNAALKGDELKGAHLFLTIGCTTCHNGPVIGGQMFMKLGLVHPYPTKDEGRFEVTKDPDDKFKFKVPMLRNIAITGPYFHDGSIKTLEEAVRKMAYHQLDKQLTDTEVKQIVAFLNTLTDKPRAKK
jgi:cytochrome c peroxidase